MRNLVLTLALATAGAVSGCTGTLSYPGKVDSEVAPGFDSRRPAEVAVLPVVGSLPPETARQLREALRTRLLDLRYAPVRLKEIDAHMADYQPGGPHAVMEVRVTKWDDGGLFGDGTVLFSAEVRLVGAGAPEVLFHSTVSKITVRASNVAKTMEDRPATVSEACTEAALKMLEDLPAKGDG